ncbi:MAG: aspartate dehydrogenase [Candidatus Omnitrophota bacterium]|jgi:aspartate dehydrogenase
MISEKTKKLKIGIAGCGAIGSSLAKAVLSDFSDKAELASLYDSEIEKAYSLSSNLGRKAAALNLEELINRSDLVIEAAKADAAFDIAKKTLSSSRDIMVMSVGGIMEHYHELEVLAQENGARIFIPSGAICGIDGLKALSLGKIKSVILTTKKPPKGFLGAPYLLKKKIRLENIDRDTVIFEGNALQAVKAFPQNINVAAILSIAGIGAQDTIVRIVASPGLSRNTHEVEIESEAGKITARTENLIHPDNPKTSYLAVLSAIAVLKQILGPVRIGT